MRILQVIFTLSSGGAERFVTDLTSELAEYKDCSVTLLLLKSDSIPENNFYRKELSPKVVVKSLGINKTTFRDLLKIYKAIKSEKPDIVHYHLAGMLNILLLTILLYRKPVYIETIHSDIKAIRGYNWKDRFIKNFCFRFHLVKVCTISNYNAQQFKKYYHRECDAMIYNARRAMKPSPLFETRRKEIECLKNHPDDLVFTHIGRCCVAKNQKMLTSAFNTFIQNGYQAILLIIGDGFNSTRGKELQNNACKNIHFIGEQHDIQDYLLNSDGFCLSSKFEGMPITLIEAFACGCIPISTPVSGAIDLIKNEDNGYLSKDYTKEEYLKALENFAQHHQQIDKNDLKESFHDYFSIKSCAHQYYTLYTKFSRHE